MMWIGVLAAAAGCYALKVAGLSIPERILRRRLVERISFLLPVALLGALAAVQTFSEGKDFDIDARAPGLAVAALALAFRAPFLVVICAAAATTALIRQFA